MRIISLSATASGSSGTATGSSVTSAEARGILRGLGIDYGGSAPAGTVATVVVVEPGGTSKTILSITGNTAYPVRPIAEAYRDSTGTVIASTSAPVPVLGGLQVTVASANAGTMVTIQALIEE